MHLDRCLAGETKGWVTDQKMMKSVPLTICSCEDEGICITSASATAPRSPAPNILQCTNGQGHTSVKRLSQRTTDSKDCGWRNDIGETDMTCVAQSSLPIMSIVPRPTSQFTSPPGQIRAQS